MSTKYVCPSCGNGDPSDFTAHYERSYTEAVTYGITSGTDDNGNDIVDEEQPDNEGDPDYGGTDNDNEEFQHFKCGNCGHTFGRFDETEEEEEEDEDEDDEDSDENVHADLTNINSEQDTLRKSLTQALEDDDLVMPSQLATRIRRALDSNAAVETLKKLLTEIREL